MVKTTPLDTNVIVPLDGSNNTGEMRATIELFDYILYYSMLPPASEACILIESQYVIRSLQGDQLPSTHHQLVELADWSKAFDSVTLEAIEAVLQYFGVPPLFHKAIMALYSNPQPRVCDSGQTSPVQSQTRGLRQQIPLSPYLFYLVLTHLFYDVETACNQQFGHLAGVLNSPFPLWDLEYDDDTTLLSSSARQLIRLLHLLQHHGSIRGLHLNFSKCEHLKLRSTERISFSPTCSSPCQCSQCNGPFPPITFGSESNEVKCLGVYLDSISINHRNVAYRISQAVSASKLLKRLLGHQSLTPTWKLTVYRSVIQSILMYAMESAQLSSSQLTRINHVHFKAIRKHFGIKSSFCHRVLNPTAADCSNEYISGLAYDTLRVVFPSQLYSQGRLSLLGHVFRREDSLEYQAGRYPQVRGPARTGRPRLHWAESTRTEASQTIEHLVSDAPPSHSDIDHSSCLPSSRSKQLTLLLRSYPWKTSATIEA